MKKLIVSILISFLFFHAAVQNSNSQEISAKDIVKRSDDLMRGDSCEGKYTMTIITPNWQRCLKLYVYSKGRDKMFIRILSPAKEKDIATLRVKNEMWNYLPSVERTIKIPPSMMLQPWMGSDFANDDLVKESSIVEDYTHKITKEEIIDGKGVWRIELTPKPQAGVIWYKRIILIRKDDFIPVLEEFYGKDNLLIKVLEYSKVKKVSDRQIPTCWQMTSKVKKVNRTIIEIDENVVYNKPMDDSLFTLQNLKTN